MTAVNGKILLVFLSMLLALACCQQQYQQQFSSDAEVPAVLSYNSPLKQPDSLKSRPYFDFLSTLYRHDTDKTQLFRPYIRNRREAIAAAAPRNLVNNVERSKRAIIFRPLFVYKQQQVRKQQIQNEHKRRV